MVRRKNAKAVVTATLVFILPPSSQGIKWHENLLYQKYYSYAELVAEHKGSRHQVFLAHGFPCLIDEQYFFEDRADAQWFWEEGYKASFSENRTSPVMTTRRKVRISSLKMLLTFRFAAR
jgi:hypothetical protein